MQGKGPGGTYPGDRAELWVGNKLLGVSSMEPGWSTPLAWKSNTSAYTLYTTNVPTIDFSGIYNGAISGKIIFQPGVDHHIEFQTSWIEISFGFAEEDGGLQGRSDLQVKPRAVQIFASTNT